MAISRILVPLDGSAIAETAYRHALTVAQSVGATIHLLRVLDSHEKADTLEWRLHKAEVLRYLRHQAEVGKQSTGDSLDIEIHTAEGKPAERIARFIREEAIDLMVLSAYGSSGPSGFPFGGTAHKVLTSQNVSYLVVRKPEPFEHPPEYRRLLVPLDGSRKAELALRFAEMISSRDGLELMLLHVSGLPTMTRKQPLTEHERTLRRQLIKCNQASARSYMREVSDSLAPEFGFTVQLDEATNPAQRIAEIAQQEQADLMVLTAYGGAELNGWSRESICQSLLAATDVPALILQDGLRLSADLARQTGGTEVGQATATPPRLARNGPGQQVRN